MKVASVGSRKYENRKKIKDEFRKVMSFMYKAFRQEPSEDEFETYYILLKVYDIAMVKQSVHSLCTTFKYFPRVADIVEAMI